MDTQVKLEDIITGISVVSANDGCIALAEHISGSVEAFVQQMNNRAKELGLSNSQFKTHGLPEDGHYMSARDIAVLSRHLINNHPKILEIESKKILPLMRYFSRIAIPSLAYIRVQTA